MRIKELHIQNFRGFEDITINFPESNVCVFIGANGNGKSSVLEVLNNILENINAFDIGQDIDKGKERRKIINDLFDNTFSFNDDDLRINQGTATYSTLIVDGGEAYNVKILQMKEGLSSQGNFEMLTSSMQKTQGIYPLLMRYSTDRFTLGKQEIINKEKERHQASPLLYQFLKHTINFDAFISWFKDLEDLENAQKFAKKDFSFQDSLLKPIRIAVNSFLSDFNDNSYENLSVFREKTTIETELKGKSEITLIIYKNGIPFKLQQLSDGEKLILMTVCDIARKLILLNPKLENPLNANGIVLIDEIELHLHPQWQRNIILALRKTFPNIQFIITTHSPQVLSNVANGEVILLENGKVFQNFAHNFGQDSNTILNDFFNTSERPQEIKTELDKLFQLIELEKLQEAKTLLGKLIEKLGESDFDLIKAKTELEYFADEIH